MAGKGLKNVLQKWSRYRNLKLHYFWNFGLIGAILSTDSHFWSKNEDYQHYPNKISTFCTFCLQPPSIFHWYHACTMPAPCLYHACTMPGTMPAPCLYHACTMPCAMPVPCLYHACTMPSTMPVPCLLHACTMPTIFSSAQNQFVQKIKPEINPNSKKIGPKNQSVQKIKSVQTINRYTK